MENKYTIAGIIDKKELFDKEVLNYKVIGCDDDLEMLFKTYKYAIITVGQIKSNTTRVKLFNKLKTIGYKLPIIISPLAYVSKFASMDEGVVIMHNVIVNVNAKIGQNCIINTKALIEHDAIIEKHSHISTGATINGGSVIKENTFFGSHAMIKEYTEIKANSIIKAGSNILT